VKLGGEGFTVSLMSTRGMVQPSQRRGDEQVAFNGDFVVYSIGFPVTLRAAA
jgi:hypothetical protein